jgi:hypothetical protein
LSDAATPTDAKSTINATAPADAGSLACATRTTLVEGVASAENLLFTSTGRLFVSGDDGIYDVVRGTDGGASLVPLVVGQTCHFAGMTEMSGTIYANCYDMGANDSHVYAATLAAKPAFSSIYDLPGTALANGLTSDGVGKLYVASTFDGRVIALTVDAANPSKITSAADWPRPSGATIPNGIKYFDGTISLTSGNDLWTSPADADSGAAGTRIYAGTSYLDDLYAGASGFVVADFGGGALRSFGPTGQPAGATASMLLTSPSSVLPAAGRLGLSTSDFVVTEKGANRVAVVHACATHGGP